MHGPGLTAALAATLAAGLADIAILNLAIAPAALGAHEQEVAVASAPRDESEPAVPAPRDDEPAVPAPRDDDEPAVATPRDDGEPAVPAPRDDDEPAMATPRDDDEPAVPAPRDDDEPAAPAPRDDDEPDVATPRDDDEPAVATPRDEPAVPAKASEAPAAAAQTSPPAPDPEAESDRVEFRIYFDTATATVREDARSTLREIARRMKAEPALEVTIRGYADQRGSATANERVSTQRAQAAAAFLEQTGVDAERMTISAHGAKRPLSRGTDPTSLAQNRRVELELHGDEP